MEVGRRGGGGKGACGEKMAHCSAADCEAEGDELGVGLEDLGEGRGWWEKG